MPRRAPAVRPKQASRPEFAVRFWGVRGSIPAPGPNTRAFGGNTPCLEVRCGDEQLIFDLGTGLRALGEAYGSPMQAHLFVSHYHYDHLQGLPFFGPIFDPRSRFTVYGPTREGQTVKDILSGQMQQPYFPVTAEMVFRAQLDYRPIAQGDRLRVGEAVVSAVEVNHPGGNLAYRIDYQGKSVVYATDNEHGTESDARLDVFSRDCDLLIYDAMYTEEEYVGRSGGPKIGWGHSTWQAAVQAAERANVGKLCLFHHEPTRSDKELERMMKAVRKHRPEAFAAAEGLHVTI